LGRKALAVNISDIAAMGGTPRLAFVSLALSSREKVESIDELYAGMEEEAEEFEVTIVGGDTSLSPGPLFIGVTLLGEAKQQAWVRRSGAQVGDTLMVTGSLGASAAGLAAIRVALEIDADSPRGKPCPLWKGFEGLTPSLRQAMQEAVDAHFLPVPRVKEGQLLAKERWAHAMIDLSDGLASDLTHLCEESGVGAEVWEMEIPLAPCAREVSRKLGEDALSLALRGGEDYELLFATPSPEAVKKAFAHAGLTPLTAIGEIVPRLGEITLVGPAGRRSSLTGGFDHFLTTGG
jgi:thiamine-monophosphate kinase